MSSGHEFEHVLLEIRKRLHDPRGSKAAVFVGAGFSRNATSTSTHAAFPLWRELTVGLVKMLYPNERDRTEVLERVGATSAALRLAQEFQTAFGRSRLIDFVRDTIRDDEFQPSQLHYDLLELPWADVFTTNYDRLLEKANTSLWKRSYGAVVGVNDLPLARRPRIVKLHGSLPALEHLVLTEEDYRGYRRNYAPFVATVQAALTENILCLVGFSGDDPNFLAWSGWLRDELRNAVPKTYLFTGDELKPFQRQLLEERHIIPIPLKRLAETNRYELAYQWLFQQLAQRPEKPCPSWNILPQQAILPDDPGISNEPFFSRDSHDWVDMAIVWRSHRQEYKGWCVLYRDAVRRLWSHTDFWTGRVHEIKWEHWSEAASIFLLYELVWRWSTSMRPLYDNVVFSILDPQMERFMIWRSTFAGKKCDVSSKTRKLEMSIAEFDDAYYYLLQQCLRHAREIGDDERYRRLLGQLNCQPSDLAPEVLNDRQSFIRHQEVLHSLGRLRYADARRQLEAWPTSKSAPIWAIRRAGLCLECDLVDLARRILDSLLRHFRSIPVSAALDLRELSCEGITLDLLGVLHNSGDSVQRSREASSARIVASPVAESPTALDEPTVLQVAHQRVSSRTPVADESRRDDKPILDASPRRIRERLTQLTDYGCNPSNQMEWLEMATSPEPTTTKGPRVREGFEIGNVSTTLSGSTERQLDLAYEAMRFVEDVGLPLKMTLPGSNMTIAANLFRNATRTIAHFAPHEAVGLVMRSREINLAEQIFSRDCLARLSATQVSSLSDSVMQAIREAVSRLAPPTRPVDATDRLWEEQFGVACEVLGRISVRLPGDELVRVFREIVNLQQLPSIRDSVWRPSPLAKCIERLGNAIDKKGVTELLPILLQTPVQGSAELPTKQSWCDPVRIVADFDWNRDTTWNAECDEQLDKAIERIAVARADERSNLCRRTADLLDANLLTSQQSGKLALALYAHCDEHGLPAETGCYDSLVLLLPPNRTNCDERDIFRRKYLTATANAATWKNLHRTNTPIQLFQPTRRRNIEWTSADISAILSLSRDWLKSVGPRPPDNVGADSKQLWMDYFDRDSSVATQAVVCDWLATLENCAFLNRQINTEQTDRLDALITEMQLAGWCVTQAVPVRAMLGKVTVAQAAEKIRCGLADRDDVNVRQACDAIVRWCELDHERGFKIPPALLQSLSSAIAMHRHEALPLLINTSTNALRRLDEPRRIAMFSQLEHGLEALLSETNYEPVGTRNPFTIGMKLRIRVSCANLVAKAASLGISGPTVESWKSAIKNDIFADVRRYLTE